MRIYRYQLSKDGKKSNSESYNVNKRTLDCADYFTQYTNNSIKFNTLEVDDTEFFIKNPKLKDIIEKLQGTFINDYIVQFDAKYKAIFAFRIIRLSNSNLKKRLELLYDIIERSNLGIFQAIQLSEVLSKIRRFNCNYSLMSNYSKLINVSNNIYDATKRRTIQNIKDYNRPYQQANYKAIFSSEKEYLDKYNKGFIYCNSSGSNSLYSLKLKTSKLKNEQEVNEYFDNKILRAKKQLKISKFKRYGTMYNALAKLEE